MLRKRLGGEGRLAPIRIIGRSYPLATVLTACNPFVKWESVA